MEFSHILYSLSDTSWCELLGLAKTKARDLCVALSFVNTMLEGLLFSVQKSVVCCCFLHILINTCVLWTTWLNQRDSVHIYRLVLAHACSCDCSVQYLSVPFVDQFFSIKLTSSLRLHTFTYIRTCVFVMLLYMII